MFNKLCSSGFELYSRWVPLADYISFLEIQRLQLAGSSSTVFAVNLIKNNPFFQRFSTGFDVLTTNTTPLDPVIGYASPRYDLLSVALQGDRCMGNKILMSAKAKYNYILPFFYKINKGDFTFASCTSSFFFGVLCLMKGVTATTSINSH